MNRLRTTLTVLRCAIQSGLADFATIYTWRTWTLGWLSRVLAQVAFFALIGRLLDSPDATRFLLIGNAVLIAVVEAAFVVASTTWERRTGTLPLLIAAPASPFVVFFGRSLYWLASGTASASIALFVLGPVFGVTLPLPAALAAVPLIGLVSFAAYCLGLALAGLVLNAMLLRNIVGNLLWWTLALLGGVQVPTAFWPTWAERVAAVLPVHHGLTAVRALLDGGQSAVVMREATWEAVVAVAWFAVAALSFDRLARRGRRDGSIEFSD